MKKITLVSQEFTFSDGSRVSWTYTDKIFAGGRLWDITISVPSPVGGFFNKQIGQHRLTPSATTSLKLIEELRAERPGLKA